MRVLRLAWLGIRTEATEAMVEFFSSTLGLRLDHADRTTVFDLTVDEWRETPTLPLQASDVPHASAEVRASGLPSSPGQS